jgi:hypothetical protein
MMNRILKNEREFQGFVMSDLNSKHSAMSAMTGLGLTIPGDSNMVVLRCISHRIRPERDDTRGSLKPTQRELQRVLPPQHHPAEEASQAGIDLIRIAGT